MYIISKDKDYYDSAVGMGIDKTIVYERHSSEEDCPQELIDILNTYRGSLDFIEGTFPKNMDRHSTSFIHVGFCGKIYLGVEIHKYFKDKHSATGERKEIEVIWNHNQLRMMLDSKEEKNKKWYWNRDKRSHLERFNNYVAILEAYDATKWFREYNTPIFVLHKKPLDGVSYWRRYHGYSNDDRKIYINPVLKNYQFVKQIDPYTAFQEIQMYISGVLGVNRDGTEFPATEKQKVAQHGMDKWSFRKKPSK